MIHSRSPANKRIERDSGNQKKYPGQQVLVVRIEDYAYLVPFVESSEGRFLKTIMPSRKATRRYLGEEHEDG